MKEKDQVTPRIFNVRNKESKLNLMFDSGFDYWTHYPGTYFTKNKAKEVVSNPGKWGMHSEKGKLEAVKIK